ncbi:DUF4260 domain-containing protein [Mesonia aquimarina]|uniref:DUF4260 domain-containing protein n=1 Tax=Mesonia aquimarina TaxID=1504967 RepID=UPI000EF60B12|nr:DUF4260 domain-containing protein [Mesonia aquimarina]
MKKAIKLEELGMFVLGIFLFSLLDISWWWFLALFFSPDIGMLGYLINNKIGAITYNIFHHKFLGLIFYLVGVSFTSEILQFIGIIIFSHASFDRIFGYGLKYNKGFKFTHLGEIGN